MLTDGSRPKNGRGTKQNEDNVDDMMYSNDNIPKVLQMVLHMLVARNKIISK